MGQTVVAQDAEGTRIRLKRKTGLYILTGAVCDVSRQSKNARKQEGFEPSMISIL